MKKIYFELFNKNLAIVDWKAVSSSQEAVLMIWLLLLSKRGNSIFWAWQFKAVRNAIVMPSLSPHRSLKGNMPWQRLIIRHTMGSKKIVKLTGHTYACNSLTNVDYEAHPLIPEEETCNAIDDYSPHNGVKPLWNSNCSCIYNLHIHALLVSKLNTPYVMWPIWASLRFYVFTYFYFFRDGRHPASLPNPRWISQKKSRFWQSWLPIHTYGYSVWANSWIMILRFTQRR